MASRNFPLPQEGATSTPSDYPKLGGKSRLSPQALTTRMKSTWERPAEAGDFTVGRTAEEGAEEGAELGLFT